MPNPLPGFSPACPIPYILQPEERVKQLRVVLHTELGQLQRVNIEALIHLYEIGDLGPRQRGDPDVFMVDGVRVEKDPWKDKSVPANALKWCETLNYQQINPPRLVNIPNPRPEFSPACPTPYILQPEERVKQLRVVLDTELGQIQRVNIEALIHLYEIGDLGPRQPSDPAVFMVDGVRVEKDPWKDKSVPANALKCRNKWSNPCQNPSFFRSSTKCTSSMLKSEYPRSMAATQT